MTNKTPSIFRRVIVIVLDSLGVGALPDAQEYGDADSNTLLHLSQAVGGIHLPCLEKIGLGEVCPFLGRQPSRQPVGVFGRLKEISQGKDSIIGHWELMGLITKTAFPTYPDGFPPEIINPFKKAIGREILGNVAASVTEIINQLAERHVETGYPIVYTSADSVFQIAAHEKIIPVKRLYEICLKARKILQGSHSVGRVIARPFLGHSKNWYRTSGRKDFSLPPPEATLLDRLKDKGILVTGIGKVIDIFAGRGFSLLYECKEGNPSVVNKIEEGLNEKVDGFIFANLVDFDMIYGHRNDSKGYAEALQYFDDRLKNILSLLAVDDLMMIVADHGCDPTTPSTDHSREYAPILAYSPSMKKGINLGVRSSFADVAQTIAQIFNISELKHGKTFLKEILEKGNF